MKPYQGSPIPRPYTRETNIDNFARSSNGDLTRNPYINIGPSRGMVGGLSGSVIGIGGHNGKRSSLGDVDMDAETATPSDTMLSPMAKRPLPDDDDDDDIAEARHKRKQPSGFVGRLAEKHGFSRKGVTLLLFLAFLCVLLQITVFVMAIMWPREGHDNNVDVCLSPDCLMASAELQGNLNLEAEPCQNFWKYSCGGWLDSNPLPNTTAYWSVNEKLKHEALDEMRSILDTMDEPRDINSIEWKLRTFYSSCMFQGTHLTIDVDSLIRTIETKLNGWNLLKNTWERRTWDFPSVLQKLHVDYGVSPFFKVDVVPDPEKKGFNIIKLYPSGFSMPHKSYYKRLPNNEVAKAYQQYVKDTVKIFGVSGPDSVDFASHFYHYESRIAEITPPDEVLNDPVKSNKRFQIGELSLFSSNIPWLDILQQMFPNSNLDHRTEILIASQGYFSSLSHLISTTERSHLCNYLIFHFVSSHMPYVVNEGSRVYNFFHNQFTGAKAAPEKWKFCMKTTEKFFGYGLGFLYERSENRKRNRPENLDQIQNMFDRLRSTMRKNIRRSKWYPSDLKPSLVSKIQNMSIVIGYPDNLLDATFIDIFYKDHYLFKKIFSKNLQEVIQSDKKLLERRLNEPEVEPPWMQALKSDDVVYVYESNKIVIPPHILNRPIFHRNYPSCITYGSLGVRIAREMLRAMDIIGLAYNSAGIIHKQTTSTNRTMRHIENLGECLALTTMSLSIEEDDYVNRTSSDTAAEVDAVRQTYEAYLDLLRDKPQLHPPSFESLNSTNIFFMSYSGSLCSELTKQQADIFRTIKISLMEYPRLLAVLSQMPEFTEVFSCTKKDFHYPQKICDSLH